MSSWTIAKIGFLFYEVLQHILKTLAGDVFQSSQTRWRTRVKAAKRAKTSKSNRRSRNGTIGLEIETSGLEFETYGLEIYTLGLELRP